MATETLQEERDRYLKVLEMMASPNYEMTGAWYRARAREAIAGPCKEWVEDPDVPGQCIDCYGTPEEHR